MENNNNTIKSLKIFLIVLLVSLPFWWGVNLFQANLENYFYAQIGQPFEEITLLEIPERIQRPPLELDTKAAISVSIDHQGVEKILFEKNVDRPLPIASLTKLMTASIFLKHYDVEREETVRLLLSLLIESDNEAANDLATIIGEDSFLELMNLEAKELGMEDTYFSNPNGLDPKEPDESLNYSTAKDLVKLSKYITSEQPLLWEISTIQEFENMENTNDLLGQIPGIIGGKTGETVLAGKCLLLVVQAPKDKGFIVNIILNSENRFEEMKKLIDWTEDAYRW
jgi:D-alanyl-D-alanine carboxypeptidase (penicillin-binding protein 5/6)